jgi:acetamidase/formamidase
VTVHHLAATPETTRIGVFDAAFPPVLTIQSGDTVVIECISGRPAVLPLPDSGYHIPKGLAAVLAARPDMPATHILTGPIAIAGAMPGDMLEVHIEAVSPAADWGYCNIRPLAGTLPHDFDTSEIFRINVDRARGLCRLPWGAELKLSPFLGIMAVAPRAAYGTIRSTEPRLHGGNMDNKELIAGSTLYLPVWEAGALFVAGDGHGLQGDGEVCVNALEMCLDARLRFRLHKAGAAGRPPLRRPYAETAQHIITMGFHPSLDGALKQALRDMIDYICARSRRTRAEAYMLCSLAVDFRVTQSVNGEKGIHGMLSKAIALDDC